MHMKHSNYYHSNVLIIWLQNSDETVPGIQDISIYPVMLIT